MLVFITTLGSEKYETLSWTSHSKKLIYSDNGSLPVHLSREYDYTSILNYLNYNADGDWINLTDRKSVV